MALSPELTRKLLTAVETDTLVFICGAGLSAAAPSSLPSAESISRKCYDALRSIEILNPDLRDHIEKLAGHFHANEDFDKFIRIIPWDDLTGVPNIGHAAVADFLITRAAHAALSSNFDDMIERWARDKRVAMRGALDAKEAEDFRRFASPLLKFHGCMVVDPEHTLWARGQLDEDPVCRRVQSVSDWIRIHLPGKDILVVGFWTDWAYLNYALATALDVQNAASVTVVDTATSDELAADAPDLWDTLQEMSESFEHVRASGDVVLDELRAEFSRSWLRKVYQMGAELASEEEVPTLETDHLSDMSTKVLYDLRRDAEGTPYDKAARHKSPPGTCAQLSLMYHALVNAGATRSGAWFQVDEDTIRVVNGAGRGLREVRGEYMEPPTITQPDIVICTGSVDNALPAKIVPQGTKNSVVDPAPGASSEWLTSDMAEERLGL